MPELPEIETIARLLIKPLRGRRVTKVEVFWPRSVATHSTKDFARALKDSVVRSLTRRGKYLVLVLDQGACKYLLFHLRMNGTLEVHPSSAKRRKHDRVILSLDNRTKLCFNDTRKFGRSYLVPKLEDVTGRLGPEPLDRTFGVAEFAARLATHRGAIKPLLLNQSFLAGLGNIYVDESLWRAGIHPLRGGSTLSASRSGALLKAIKATLKRAISAQGTDLSDGVVHFGNYHPQVYGRSGQPCPRCKNVIRRTVVCQRGTHYCPKCQR